MGTKLFLAILVVIPTIYKNVGGMPQGGFDTGRGHSRDHHQNHHHHGPPPPYGSLDVRSGPFPQGPHGEPPPNRGPNFRGPNHPPGPHNGPPNERIPSNIGPSHGPPHGMPPNIGPHVIIMHNNGPPNERIPNNGPPNERIPNNGPPIIMVPFPQEPNTDFDIINIRHRPNNNPNDDTNSQNNYKTNKMLKDNQDGTNIITDLNQNQANAGTKGVATNDQAEPDRFLSNGSKVNEIQSDSTTEKIPQGQVLSREKNSGHNDGKYATPTPFQFVPVTPQD